MQAPPPMIPPQFLDRLLDLLQIATIAGIGWLVRVQMQTRDDVRDIKHTLFGPQGTNGLRGDMKEAQDEQAAQHTHIVRLADGLNETRRAVQLPERDYLHGT
jgi:hypothetical protein